MGQVRLVDAYKKNMLIGCDCVYLNIFVVEMVFECDMSETQLPGDCFLHQGVLIKDVIGAVIEEGSCEVQALRFVPVGRKGIDHA